MIVLGFSSCNQSSEPQWISLSFGPPEGAESEIFGDMGTNEEVDELSVQRRCPTLSRVRVLPQGESFSLVEIKGSGLAGVQGARARLSTGEVAQVECRFGDGVLRCPVAAKNLELYFGFQANGGLVSCRGEGYSLRLQEGAVLLKKD